MRGMRRRAARLVSDSIGPPHGLEGYRLDRLGEVVLLTWCEQRPSAFGRLTPAEREVVLLLSAGLSNAAIARRRARSQRTVANQVASIFAKLGVSSRSELLAGSFTRLEDE